MLLFLLSIGCNGCQPSLPNPNDDEDPPEDSPPTDSPVDTVDTSPPLPPRCDLLEVEPNDTISQVTPFPMEQWVCGVLQPPNPEKAPLGDVEFLSFSTTEPGWVEVSVEAARRGSSADMQIVLSDDDDSVTVVDSYLTTDPLVRFPTTTPGAYTAVLGESTFLYGEDYAWYLLASVVKAPVEWSFDEIEPNDSMAEATPFTVGETVFGVVGRVGDFDWYHLTTPAEATKIRFTVEAYAHGSPTDLTLLLYETDGTTLLREDHTGEVDYDRDPWWEQKQEAANDWYLVARNNLDKGSRFYWYTIKIESIIE